MRRKQQEYELVPIGNVTFHPDNPRKGNIAEIRKSVRANGFYGAVVAQRSTGHILAGNHRFLAAKAEGATEIPVIWLDVDDDRAKRIMLVDNRSNDLAGYDEDKLREMLAELSNATNLVGTGYDRAFLDEMLKGLAVGQSSRSATAGGGGAAPAAPGETPGEAEEPRLVQCPCCGHEFELTEVAGGQAD